MKKRYCVLFIFILSLCAGCVKETYDLTGVADDITLSPSYTLPFAFGDVSFADLVESNDNIEFGDDRSARLFFLKDSAINISIDDLVPFDTLFEYLTSETIGNVKIANFSTSFSFTLDEISRRLSTEIRNQLLALDGLTGTFPPFSQIVVGTHNASAYTNFNNATFSEGYIDVTLSNTLSIPLQGAAVEIVDTRNNSVIGTVSFSAIDQNGSATRSLNVAGKSFSNSMSFSLTINGSDGASNVYVDMANSGIEVNVVSRDLSVSAGRVVIPLQEFPNIARIDTLTVDIDNSEVEEIALRSGKVNFEANSDFYMSSVISYTLPSVTMDGSVFDQRLNILGDGSASGSVDIDNSVINLAQDVNHPFNRLPFVTDISLSSNGEMVDFSSLSTVSLKFWISDFELDYIKGYFGQRTSDILQQSINMDADDFLDKLSGSVSFANPEAKITYRNSFAIPIRVNFNAFGETNGILTNLNYAPFVLSSPIGVRDAEGVISINNTNSSIADVMSTIPDRFVFSGSIVTNPDGNTEERDNYLFGDSRIVGDVEIELPLQFSCENLLFTDTLDNLLYVDDDDDSSISEYIDRASLIFVVDNGFPMSATVSIVLYDSATSTELYEVNIPETIVSATVDGDGKVTASKESRCRADLDDTFWSVAEQADKMIMKFNLSTAGSDDVDISLNSDYDIKFNVVASVKTNVEL